MPRHMYLPLFGIKPHRSDSSLFGITCKLVSSEHFPPVSVFSKPENNAHCNIHVHVHAFKGLAMSDCNDLMCDVRYLAS